VQLLANKKVPIKSCTLWAPAITVAELQEVLPPSGRQRKSKQFTLFTLDDQTEQDDDCGKIYNKSLLYLVSNAFEEKRDIPLFRDGIPILGMEKFVKADAELQALFKKEECDLDPFTKRIV